MASLENTELFELLEPGAAALGFELLAVEISGSGGSTVLRAYIDGADGVAVDDCARVSRQLSAILDVEDPLPGRYTLEVSSPGLDRPLSKRRHFELAIGQDVNIRTGPRVVGRHRFTGVLRRVTDDTVVVDVDGEPYDIPLLDIVKARLVPDYESLNKDLTGNR